MGKQIGIPPLTALEPSRAALEETKIRSVTPAAASVGDAAFHEMTVAP
jgi:hypothetical protein